MGGWEIHTVVSNFTFRIEFHMVWVPGSLVAKLAWKAAGLQVGLWEKCRMPIHAKVDEHRNSLEMFMAHV